jgi:hypothetical protein
MPIRLDTLSGDPAVVIRTIGIAERTDLVVAMRFEVEDRFRQRTLVFHHDFGDIAERENAARCNSPAGNPPERPVTNRRF